ncbi:MAG TPA: tetratricopeptide repeat protein [Pyrinomonadaceae bacterium]|nr:tetratricopeptide repeat protein [Pyrinomonadaceae bacterium]
MKLLWASLAITILCTSAIAQQIKLNGRLITDEKKPVPSTRVGIAGQQSALTDMGGRFSITLSPNLREGERVIIVVEKKNWVINYPLDGEWNLPAIALQNVQTLDVIIVPWGSRALWTHARIEKELKQKSDEIAKLRNEFNQPKGFDINEYVQELSRKYGSPPDITREAFDQWAQNAGESADNHIKGLMSFYNQNFISSAEHFKKAANQTEANAAEEWRLAGNSSLLAYEFRDALESYERSLTLISRMKDPEKWAEVTNRIGIAKLELGIRVSDTEGRVFLSESVYAFRQNLAIYNREQQPQCWATTQNNLGIALREEGTRAEAPEARRLLREAVMAGRQALLVFTREQLPQDWARTQHNLANALLELGTRIECPEGCQLLSEAVAVNRQALLIRTREQLPQQWAWTQNNLGNALMAQGIRSPGPEALRLLREAIAAYHQALLVFTREQLPQDWAMTQHNLGTALQEVGSRTEGPEGLQLLSEAVRAYRAALLIRTRDQVPQPWAQTQNNLANTLQLKGARMEGPEALQLLGEAIAFHREVLLVFTREKLPQDWARTQHNLGSALVELSTKAVPSEAPRLLGEAVAAYRQALSIFTREQLPQQWAWTQKNLARAYFNLREWSSAAQCYENVLEVYPASQLEYEKASFLEHDVLFNYKRAFELNQVWLQNNPHDLSAIAKFAEKHFTIGSFDESERYMSSLALFDVRFPPETKIALQTIEIANLIGLNKSTEVPLRMKKLIELLQNQPPNFSLQWSFGGTKHFISESHHLAANKAWLLQFFAAMEGENRDAIIKGLKSASENLNP